MKVTLKQLDKWGACQEALDWWKRDHPDGEDASLDVLVNKVIPEKCRKDWGEWFLFEVAARVDGPEGDEALDMLIADADASILTRIVTHITSRDTSKAMAKLTNEGGAEYLASVLERGSVTDARLAAAALLARDPAIAKFCERTLQPERAAFITAARRAG